MMGLDPYVAGETNSDGRTGNIYAILDFSLSFSDLSSLAL